MSNRPLFIDFSIYNDKTFEQELMRLMIADLRELQKSVTSSLERNEMSAYHLATHKANSTIKMLNDQELTDAIKDLKSGGNREQKSTLILRLCAEVISSLEALGHDSVSSRLNS